MGFFIILLLHCGFDYFGGWGAVWSCAFWWLVHCVVAVIRNLGLYIPKVPNVFITVLYNEVPADHFFQHSYMFGIYTYIDMCQINDEKHTQNLYKLPILTVYK